VAVQSSPARFAVAVASGKGGVGKSTVSLNLAIALAEGGRSVGLLDADFYGPDIPVMVNLTRHERLDRWQFWSRERRLSIEPVERFGVKIISVGFFLGEAQAFALPAQWTYFVGRQLVHEVAWGELDYLVIDLPPGTADLQQELIRILPLSGALVVVGPQDVAHLDAKKVLDLLGESQIRVLGAVENMAALECPHCHERIDVFPQVAPERSVWATGIARLARVPLHPAIAETSDGGTPFLVASPSAPPADAFRQLAASVAALLEGA
jgi:ATP-binding protein involved in chromosome partitioning